MVGGAAGAVALTLVPDKQGSNYPGYIVHHERNICQINYQAAEDSHQITLSAKSRNDGITFSFFANGAKIVNPKIVRVHTKIS